MTLKNTNILRNLSLLLCMMFITSCHNDEWQLTENETTLQITIRSAANSIVTRGIEDLDDDGNISEEELIVDGRRMYRLAIFLLDGNRIVTSTVLEANDQRFTAENTEATITLSNLDYTRTYRLYAVANYGNYGELTGNLSEINESNITGELRVNTLTDNLCNSKVPYPLSLTKEISLTPGANTVNGELTRTYARLRLNIRNQSSLNDLFITDLSFASNFTQQNADLFQEGGTANVSPIVTSTGAITPFVQDMMIPKISAEQSINESTIFDAYLLESTGGDYSYTLDLKYEGAKKEEYYVSSTGITSLDKIEDGEMYVIRFTNSNRYLYANGNRVGAGSSYTTDGNLNHNYVWKFRNVGTNMYTIESMGETGYYMQSSQISSTSLPLTVNLGSSDYFTAITSGSNLRLRGTRNNYYIAVNSSSVYGNNSTSNTNQRRYNLILYKVEKREVVSEITHKEKIPIRIIDKNTGAATPITSIRRNDFIDILVNVTYNEKSGDVEFEVADWDSVEGDVTFD